MTEQTIKAQKIQGPSVTLPKFGDWQAASEWRDQLEADIYVEALPVGRGNYVAGRISWRTVPGMGDEWRPNGGYLYRCADDGSVPFGLPDPTDTMWRTARDAVAGLLPEVSDTLRADAARAEIKRRDTRARDEYERTLSDTLQLAAKMEQVLGLESGHLHRTAYGVEEVGA